MNVVANSNPACRKQGEMQRVKQPENVYRKQTREDEGNAREIRDPTFQSRCAVGLALASLLYLGSTPRACSAQMVTQRGTMQIKEGQVTFERPPLPPTPAPEPQPLDFGDRLQTAELSWAVVGFADLSRIRVREFTTLEVVKPSALTGGPGLKIHRGAAYVADLPRFREFRVETPHVAVAPDGTEFLIEVTDTGTRVVMFDGQADLENAFGVTTVRAGEQGLAEPGKRPTTARLEARSLVQWWLYYPGVLDPDELNLAPGDGGELDPSLAAYRAGALTEALRKYPGHPVTPALPTEAEKIYYAALLLSVGAVDKAQSVLSGVAPESSLASALRTLIAAVTSNPKPETPKPQSASEWLALSYQHQSAHQLEAALQVARNAVEQSPRFGFGWARVAELEFSFGRTREAREALRRSLDLAPRNAQAHALNGFLFAADNRIHAALLSFDEAIRLDRGLGNAWLGRGLCRIRLGQFAAGQEDLQAAAVLEPNRALLHSYLGKAFSEAGEVPQASKELEFARRLDPNDPTALLYSALIHRDQNRINEAVADLEESIRLNDNRAVYRSRLLLDQDRAVRGANLAAIYRDVGMTDLSVQEAARAVNMDYANFSAHLFLANSYSDLLNYNPQVNLRHETPRVSEYLVASLLAPAGAGVLSPTVSQQEYSKLFERDRVGLTSSTEYLSRGAWTQAAAQYGIFGDFSYSLDAYHRWDPGQRVNNDLELASFSVRSKYQLTPADSIFLQVIDSRARFGDLAQYYDASNPVTGANPLVRGEETQEPILLAGYHHEWSPHHHTLVLAGRLEDTLRIDNPLQSTLLLLTNGGGEIAHVVPHSTDQSYRSDLEIYTAEVQHIFQHERFALILGGRAQAGHFETRNTTVPETNLINGDVFPAEWFDSPPQEGRSHFERWTGYGYAHWQAAPPLRLIAGLAYDHLTYPVNFRYSPISEGEDTIDQLSPKGGLLFTPWKSTTMRAAYSRSLGGASIDQSFRLEPTQVAGFNQAWRSLAPESVVGANAAERFETWNLSLEHALPTHTYLAVSGEWLQSEIHRTFGAYDFVVPGLGMGPFIWQSGTRERLDFSERTLVASINQLAGEAWALGARYRVSLAELENRFPEVPTSASAEGDFRRSQQLEAILHQIHLFMAYNDPSGYFLQFDSVWSGQSNDGYASELPGDEFWQFNLHGGYRFPRRQAEIRVGILNLNDQDYRLNPLNLTTELPRERTLVASLRFSF
jgi:tetratricopeptide (TPR) repeat protein